MPDGISLKRRPAPPADPQPLGSSASSAQSLWRQSRDKARHSRWFEIDPERIAVLIAQSLALRILVR